MTTFRAEEASTPDLRHFARHFVHALPARVDELGQLLLREPQADAEATRCRGAPASRQEDELACQALLDRYRRHLFEMLG